MRKSGRLPLEQVRPYLLEVTWPAWHDHAAPPPSPLVWRNVFGNDHPVEIEVGIGKGLFLLTQAQAHPGVNWLGVEIERKYAMYSANRLAKRDLSNAKVAPLDAKRLLADGIPAASVQAVHVFFPDPWWKTRHRKRRLMTPDFVASIVNVLSPKGTFTFVSDVKEYFEQTAALLAQHPALVSVAMPAAALPATNFARKSTQAGRPHHAARYSKTGGENGGV